MTFNVVLEADNNVSLTTSDDTRFEFWYSVETFHSIGSREQHLSVGVVTVVGSFAIGMTIRASRMPVPGETLLGRGFELGPGGKGSNQAIAARRLGAKSFFVGAVGADAYGEIAKNLWDLEGVDSTYVVVSEDLPTGVGFIIVDDSGENCIVVDPGANAGLSMDQIAADGAFDRADVVSAVLEIPLDTALDAMRRAKQSGAITLLNPAPAPPSGISADDWEFVDIVTPNESELRLLLGLASSDATSTEDLALRLSDISNTRVIVTRGQRGAIVVDGDGLLEVPSPRVEVIDTTGAGDAFNAALAVSLADGNELLAAVRFACSAGAYACSTVGVVPALGTRKEIDTVHRPMYG